MTTGLSLRILILFTMFLQSLGAFQAEKAAPLAESVKAVLGQTGENEDAFIARLLATVDRASVSAVLLDLTKQNKAKHPGDPEYYLLRLSVFALGYLKEPQAIPLLIELASPTERSKANEDIRLIALQALGRTDPVGNRDLLLAVLRTDEQWYIRRSAASILSNIGDTAVLQELDVAAAREPTPAQSQGIQKDADALRTRLAAANKGK